MENEKKENAGPVESMKEKLTREQKRMITDLSDIEGIVEKEATENNNAAVFYFEPIYRKVKEMKIKLLNDIEAESRM